MNNVHETHQKCWTRENARRCNYPNIYLMFWFGRDHYPNIYLVFWFDNKELLSLKISKKNNVNKNIWIWVLIKSQKKKEN